MFLTYHGTMLIRLSHVRVVEVSEDQAEHGDECEDNCDELHCCCCRLLLVFLKTLYDPKSRKSSVFF